MLDNPPTLTTERLTLRPWREEDLIPFADLNADPEVMEFMPNCLNRQESDAMAERIQQHFAQHGFGLWAIEIPGKFKFIGYTGLLVPTFQAHFTPCVEIGWRLSRAHWGNGYATEAAKAALSFGFNNKKLQDIVSFTVPQNTRSINVMKRLGMKSNPEEDFNHPNLPEGHPLQSHVLYRLKKSNSL